MNEVTKLYKNAGVSCKPNYVYNKVPILSGLKYPPFTAEKQLELIKWLSKKELKIRTNKQPYAVFVGILGNDNTCFYGCQGLYLEQTLSELINNLWQDLTEEERKQIRGILE